MLFVQLQVYIFLATLALTLTNLEGEESFDASMLGQADEVVQERISDDELVLIKGSVSLFLVSNYSIYRKLYLISVSHLA